MTPSEGKCGNTHPRTGELSGDVDSAIAAGPLRPPLAEPLSGHDATLSSEMSTQSGISLRVVGVLEDVRQLTDV